MLGVGQVEADIQRGRAADDGACEDGNRARCAETSGERDEKTRRD